MWTDLTYPWVLVAFFCMVVYFVLGDLFADLWKGVRKEIWPPEYDFEVERLNEGFHLGGRSESLPETQVLKRQGSQLNTPTRSRPHAASDSVREQALD